MIQKSESDTRQYWLILRRRKRWLVLSLLLFIGIGVLLNAYTTPVYRATTQVEINRPPTRSLLTGDLLDQSTTLSENLALYTTAQLITNRVLMVSVVRTLRDQGVVLRDLSRPNPLRALLARPAVASVWARIAGEGTVPAARGEDAQLKQDIEWVLDRLSIVPVRDTRLVNINAEHWDPASAERIANAVAQAFTSSRTEEASSGSTSLIGYLGQQLDQVRQEIASRGGQLRDSSQQGSVGQEARQRQLNETVTDLRRRLLSLDSDLARARQVYKGEHPKIIALLTERQTVERNLQAGERELGSISGGLERDASLGSQLKSLRDFQALLETRLRDAQLMGQMLTPLVRIVEPAIAGQNPIRPRKTLNMLLCVLSGMLVGTGLAFVRDSLNPTIRTPRDVSDHLRLPVLGIIRKGT